MRRIVSLNFKVLCAIALYVSVLLSFTACIVDASNGLGDEPVSGQISIAHLKTLARDNSTPILYDVTIEGYVAANDLYGEYYKSIVICDDSGGIEISLDSDDLAMVFPVAAHVVVHCNSLALGDYGGTLVLGAQPTGEFLVDRIAEQDIGRYFTIDTTNPKMVEAEKISLADLSERHINNVVVVEDVSFGEQAGLEWCERDAETGEFVTTERTMSSRSGESIGVRILGSCRYASERIPEGFGIVGAVVEHHDGVYLLRIINRNILF